MRKKKSDLLKMMFQYIEDEFVYEYDSYEEFPVIDYYPEMDSLVEKIPVADRMAVLATLAISYINMGIIYAKSHLTAEEFSNYIIYGNIVYDEDEFKDNGSGFCIPHVMYSRKANTFQFNKSHVIDIHKDPFFDRISQVIGIDDFIWLYSGGCYSFIPKDFERYIDPIV